jgi:hypothetical protein
VNANNMNARVSHSSAGSYQSNADFHFVCLMSSGVNPVFNLRRLDEFTKIKGVPKSHQLAIAYRSVGEMSKQWVEIVSHQLDDLNFNS